MSITLIFKNKPRLLYGSGAPSKFIPPTNGRKGIYVMSDGALEKEEVEYLAEVSAEKERERSNKKRETKENMEILTKVALSAPEGERAKVLNELLKTKARQI